MGDIFGAPLAVEGLLAFFMESVFLGLWIFGWDRLPKKVHAATIWMAAIGTLLSAYFILAANSFMQHPTAYTFNAETNRVELDNFFQVLFQDTAVVAFAHTITAAFITAGAVMAGISGWLLSRKRQMSPVDPQTWCRDDLHLRTWARYYRRLPGARHGRAAADEDGSGGGVVRDLSARSL